MALSSVASSCDSDAWKEKRDEALKISGDGRYFEAVQLINSALEIFEHSLGDSISSRKGQLITDPFQFAEEFGSSLQGTHGADLASLWATRADVLMNLGGLRRAKTELLAAAQLSPEDKRIAELRSECERLQKVQEQGFVEEIAAAEGKKISAHILTGFLGSGKTTLLNDILSGSHGKKFAVIENEFGEIGIDDSLIERREELGVEQIIEMNNGCICCTVRGDLIKGLKNILKKTSLDGVQLDGVIIETTGLADPAPVAQTFFADDFIQARMVLDGIITLIDAKHALQHLREEKPEGVENEAVEQVAFADRILLNKTDLVDDKELAEVEAEIRKINSMVPIVRTQYSKIDFNEVIGIRGFSLDRVLEADAEFLSDDQDHQHDATVSSVGIECSGECDLERLNTWVSTLLKERGTDIFRTKGILAVKGCEQKFVFQGIHMIFGGQPQGDWKKDEKRQNKLVFIGRNLNREELEAGFKGTLVQRQD
eukprot:TRINITY_DN63204_c0_g1_i1.p1 TRINITY_DN63204_c0_g1~~TRINITY_DN63204_c0_g1_i1.p1  ORF type:complete len:484 (+),score=109.64 TRINITY_DN63204_c0_g1_i1:2-1453(+)